LPSRDQRASATAAAVLHHCSPPRAAATNPIFPMNILPDLPLPAIPVFPNPLFLRDTVIVRRSTPRFGTDDPIKSFICSVVSKERLPRIGGTIIPRPHPGIAMPMWWWPGHTHYKGGGGSHSALHVPVHAYADRQTDRQADRQAGRQTGNTDGVGSR